MSWAPAWLVYSGERALPHRTAPCGEARPRCAGWVRGKEKRPAQATLADTTGMSRRGRAPRDEEHDRTARRQGNKAIAKTDWSRFLFNNDKKETRIKKKKR